LATLLDIAGVAVEPGSRVLEIGCGVGRLTRGLAAKAGEVIALDVSAEMLARARDHNEELDNVTWLLGDGSTLAGVETRASTRAFPTWCSSTSPIRR